MDSGNCISKLPYKKFKPFLPKWCMYLPTRRWADQRWIHRGTKNLASLPESVLVIFWGFGHKRRIMQMCIVLSSVHIMSSISFPSLIFEVPSFLFNLTHCQVNCNTNTQLQSLQSTVSTSILRQKSSVIRKLRFSISSPVMVNNTRTYVVVKWTTGLDGYWTLDMILDSVVLPLGSELLSWQE